MAICFVNGTLKQTRENLIHQQVEYSYSGNPKSEELQNSKTDDTDGVPLVGNPTVDLTGWPQSTGALKTRHKITARLCLM